MNPKSSRYYTYIKPALQNKYVRTYFGTVFSIITITIFSLFAIKPTVSTIVSLQKSIKEQSQTLDQLKKKSSDLSLAKKNFDELDQSTKDDLKLLIPNKTALPELIADISSLISSYQATSSGIQVEPVTLEPEPTKLRRNPDLKEISFSVNVQGSYSQLSQLIDKLTKDKRLVNIKKININKPEDNSNLTMSITATAYYFKN